LLCGCGLLLLLSLHQLLLLLLWLMKLLLLWLPWLLLLFLFPPVLYMTQTPHVMTP